MHLWATLAKTVLSVGAWHNARSYVTGNNPESAPAAVLILPIGFPNSSSSGLKFVILRLLGGRPRHRVPDLGVVTIQDGAVHD